MGDVLVCRGRVAGVTFVGGVRHVHVVDSELCGSEALLVESRRLGLGGFREGGFVTDGCLVFVWGCCEGLVEELRGCGLVVLGGFES